jgi:hypothetical protein
MGRVVHVAGRMLQTDPTNSGPLGSYGQELEQDCRAAAQAIHHLHFPPGQPKDTARHVQHALEVYFMGYAQAGHFLTLAAQAYSAGHSDVGQTMLVQSYQEVSRVQPYASVVLVFRPVTSTL